MRRFQFDIEYLILSKYNMCGCWETCVEYRIHGFPIVHLGTHICNSLFDRPFARLSSTMDILRATLIIEFFKQNFSDLYRYTVDGGGGGGDVDAASRENQPLQHFYGK